MLLPDEVERLENGLAVPVAVGSEHRLNETRGARRIQDPIVDAYRSLMPCGMFDPNRFVIG